MTYRTVSTPRTRPFSKGPGSVHGWTTTGRRFHAEGDGYVMGARLGFWAVLACVVMALMVLS